VRHSQLNRTRRALYDELRDETDLIANLVQEAIRRAVQATKGCVERWKQGKRVSQPGFTSRVCCTTSGRDLYRDRVSLSTVNGRVKGDFELPADSLTPYERYVLSEDVEQDVIWTVPTPGMSAIVRDVVTNHVVGPVSR